MTSTPSHNPAAKFDTSRANEYATQSRIALAGYDACHDLAACMLAAQLGEWRPAKVLVVGAVSTAQEVQARLGKILQGADPPHSEAAVQALLHEAGFGEATRFFSRLFWGAWLTCKNV
ncbi:hypothetical protein [Pseudomonas sp. McL0111]|uniref:hypothetical protein n=1 Tax=Pseudomonas sp. McL0111 TaxID=3457357 RepID=UPI00403E5E3A